MLLKHGILQTLEDGSEETPNDQLRRLLRTYTAAIM